MQLYSVYTIYDSDTDQFNMAVFFWYLVKRDLSSVRYSTRVYLTSHFVQGLSEKHGHIYLVTL